MCGGSGRHGTQRGDHGQRSPHGNAEEQEKFFTLQEKGYEHPIVSPWKDPAAGTLATAHFYRAYELKPITGVSREAGEPQVVLRYSDGLEAAIVAGALIEAGSPWEVELRAHTIYATSLLCERVNELRPAELRVIPPHIDARLWVPFHKTHAPHHLTRTIYY